MELYVKFKGTRAPWPASRLSCSRPLHGRMHLQRTICIDWLQFQLGESDVTFSRVTKASRRVEWKGKRLEKERRQEKASKMEGEEFAVSYCRRHNRAGNPSTDATVFILMQNEPIHNRKLQSDNAVKNFLIISSHNMIENNVVIKNININSTFSLCKHITPLFQVLSHNQKLISVFTFSYQKLL